MISLETELVISAEKLTAFELTFESLWIGLKPHPDNMNRNNKVVDRDLKLSIFII
tara:strand:- start:1116 stop:1280 length:165 start_codon:yes stop_codon:yes gene_type:complete